MRTLLGDRVTDVVTASAGPYGSTASPRREEFRDFFKTNYGPTIAAYRGLADDPERVAALDGELAELARRHDLGGGAMDWEYLLVTASRAG